MHTKFLPVLTCLVMTSTCIAQDTAPIESKIAPTGIEVARTKIGAITYLMSATVTTESIPLTKGRPTALAPIVFTVTITDGNTSTQRVIRQSLPQPVIATSGTITTPTRTLARPISMRDWNRLRNGSPPTWQLLGPEPEKVDLFDLRFRSQTPASGTTLQTDPVTREHVKLLKPTQQTPKRLPRKQTLFIERPQTNESFKQSSNNAMNFLAKTLALLLSITMSIFVIGTLLEKQIMKAVCLGRDVSSAIGLAVTYVLLGILLMAFVISMGPIALIVSIGYLIAGAAIDTWKYNKQLTEKTREARMQQAEFNLAKAKADLKLQQHRQHRLEAEEELLAAKLAADLQEEHLREAVAREQLILAEARIAGLAADALIAKARGEDPRAKHDLNQADVDFDNTLGG